MLGLLCDEHRHKRVHEPSDAISRTWISAGDSEKTRPVFRKSNVAKVYGYASRLRHKHRRRFQPAPSFGTMITSSVLSTPNHCRGRQRLARERIAHLEVRSECRDLIK
jgi:hypothetical protein